MSWWVGAWRRDGIAVPGRDRTEPCAAWWVQAGEWFVDVRVVVDGPEDNGLPYSQTRAFAGRFELDGEGAPCWHVEVDSAGPAPRLDRGAPGGLWLDADDRSLMIEDAPGRFREWWRRDDPTGLASVERTDAGMWVTIGSLVAVVTWRGGEICEASVRHTDGTVLAAVPVPPA